MGSGPQKDEELSKIGNFSLRRKRINFALCWFLAKKLAEELDGWLSASGLVKSDDVRGVIAPHAGYSYSGHAAAYAFGNIDPTSITRVFLLGPSHHYYTPNCALSRATVYKTPIGDLPIDLEDDSRITNNLTSLELLSLSVLLIFSLFAGIKLGFVPIIEELKATRKFELMDLQVDEAEHSMEMHLPYLAKVFYGFNFTHYDKKHGAIHKSIEALDRMGMDIIETGDPEAFKHYLSEYDNTICGRHPISVFLHMLKNSSTKMKIKFLRYEQSSQCKSMRDSSVSYASAVSKVDPRICSHVVESL
ncbi:hypothetical protein RHSIM_Rhsim07G0160700 [Rhododendron simsii]|uniref:Uncharacterized protein n=1 Tax=Rhododendron simsii TaxID=118357 RepID=A0A834GTH6_RHOSS|nr:hypothetical protein RHSIM_Rhsim07G0160700 [Rhododendron simsii]